VISLTQHNRGYASPPLDEETGSALP